MNKQNTTELDKKVRELFSQLPEPYQKALKSLDLNQAIESIADKHDLDQDGLVSLDREVTYLLLQVQTTAEFMTRLEKKLGLSEDTVVEMANDVTRDIIRPLNEKVGEIVDGNEVGDIPVPNPPSQNQDDEPPTPDYGGKSDPYQEPSE